MVRRGSFRHGRLGSDWHDVVRLGSAGMAWHGMVWTGSVGYGRRGEAWRVDFGGWGAGGSARAALPAVGLEQRLNGQPHDTIQGHSAYIRH